MYDYHNKLFNHGSALTSAYGWISFWLLGLTPQIPAGYVGRVPMVAETSSPVGPLTQTSYWPAPTQAGVFGVLPESNTGVLTITHLDSLDEPVIVDVVNGSFAAPALAGVRGTFRVSFDGISGESFSREFTKDASDYFVLLGRSPAPCDDCGLSNLTVNISGPGSGTITNSPNGIDCPGACGHDYPTGTQITLNAFASVGSSFTGWSGACTGKAVCVVTMDGPKNVTAAFGPLYADLAATSISNPPAVLVLKQTFTITDAISNQGAPAGSTTTRFYLSHDAVRSGKDKRLAGKRKVPPLTEDGTSTGRDHITVPASTKLGIYYLWACADDLNIQFESDETNNCVASTTVVEVRGADLIETTVSNPPSTITRGDSIVVGDTVENQGNALAFPSSTLYYLSLDTTRSANDVLLFGIRGTLSLDAGASSPGTITVTVPTSTLPGSYYLLACADDLKKVPESNEKNNCKASAARVIVNP